MDFALESTIDLKFTTRNTSGVPTTLAGTPEVVVYVDNSTTEITAAETLTVDFDSVTGLNNVRIACTAANGFESGKSYAAVISAGTVGGTSVVGEVVANFTIERSDVNVRAISDDATAANNLEAAYDGTGYDLGGIDVSVLNTAATAIGSDGTNLTEAGGTGDQFTAIPWNAAWDAEVQSECNDALVALGLDHLVSAAVVGTDVTDNSIAAKLVSASATADWDDFVNTTDSLQAIRDRGDAAWTTGAGGTPPQLLQSTTIATLASQTSFTLTAGSADDDAYNGAVVVVTDASTSTQKAVGRVSDYTGSTKTVTLAADPGIFTMAVGDSIDVIAATGSDLTTVDSNVTAIKAVTDNIPDSGAMNDLAAILADTGTTGVTIATATAQAIADEILKRSVSNVEGTASNHSLCELVLSAFESALSGTSWTIKQTDGTTTFNTRTVTTDANADPITSVT